MATLRVVQPGETVEPASIEDAADQGSARDLWASMRRALARKLDSGEIASNAIASAYKELRELDRLIRQADEEAAAERARTNDDSRRGRRSFNAAAI